MAFAVAQWRFVLSGLKVGIRIFNAQGSGCQRAEILQRKTFHILAVFLCVPRARLRPFDGTANTPASYHRNPCQRHKPGRSAILVNVTATVLPLGQTGGSSITYAQVLAHQLAYRIALCWSTPRCTQAVKHGTQPRNKIHHAPTDKLSNPRWPQNSTCVSFPLLGCVFRSRGNDIETMPQAAPLFTRSQGIMRPTSHTAKLILPLTHLLVSVLAGRGSVI